MKIVMLNGQNHKGSSYHVGKMIVDRIDGENEVTEFFFPRDLNHFCLGCYQCIEHREACPCFEEKEKIMQAIDAADVLVVTTPTYCMHVSAPLKAFIDLAFDYWMVHRPMKSMFAKRAVVVSTSAGASTKGALKDVETALFNMGVPKIYKYGSAVHAMNWDGVSEDMRAKLEKKTTALAKKLSKTTKPSVGLKTKFMFGMMRMLQKKGWNSSPVEKAYWESQGWLGSGRPWKACEGESE